MRTVFQLAARRKPLSRSFLCQWRPFVLSHGMYNQYRTSTPISLRHSSTNVENESHESSGNLDLFDAKEMADADLNILLSKLNLDLKSGSILSNEILPETVALLTRGCVIPTSFFLNAVDILAKRKEPYLIEKLLNLVRSISQSFAADPDSKIQTPHLREKASTYEYSKIATYSIKRLLRHSTENALTLWNRVTDDGYKASRADLIEMLKEIIDSEVLPDIALTLKITALMQQNAWNNSADYYRSILAVYHSYVERKNKQSLPALITVCNYFDRTFQEYERRIAVSNVVMRSIHGTLSEDKSQSRNLVGMDLGPGRRRAELPATDEEIHALRASFWVAAYSASTHLRHVKGVDGRPSGEDIYDICKKRAFDRYGSFVSFDGQSEAVSFQKPSMLRESQFKFKVLSGLLNDLQVDYTQNKFGSSSVSTPASPVSSLLEQISVLKPTPSAGSNMDMNVNFDHVVLPPSPKVYGKFLSDRFQGWSKVVVPSKSEYDVENLESYQTSRQYDSDNDAASESMPEVYMTKDFDTFKNNCRISERSKRNDEGWNDNQRNEKVLELKRQSDMEKNDVDTVDVVSSSSGAIVQEWEKHVNIDNLVEGALLKARRTLILQLAGTSYQSQDQDHLLLQLDAFLESSKRSHGHSKAENEAMIEVLLADILAAARFIAPLRPAYLYRPRAANELVERPEFYQQLVSALLPEKSDSDSAFEMTLEEIEKRQVRMEEENMKNGLLDSSNRFCDVARLRSHIEKVNTLAEQLLSWGRDNDLHLGNKFLAAWVGAYVRPYHSQVHFKRNMDRPKSDFDWRQAFKAARELLVIQGDENDVHTPEVYHSLIRILCDHSNCNKESLRLAYDMTTKEMWLMGVKPLPESYAVITKGATQILDDVDLLEFIKPSEKFAGLEYEGNSADAKTRVGPPPLNNIALLQELLSAHGRLQGGYECLFLMKNLRDLNSRVKLSQIAGATSAIAHVDRISVNQNEIADMLKNYEYSRAAELCDFFISETMRWGYKVDHIVLVHCLDIMKSRMLAAKRIDRKNRTLAMYDRKEAIYAGRKEESDEFVYKEDVMTNLACRDMVKFVKRRVDLESDRPEDKIAKQWILRHIMTMYLSIQYIRDAAVVLKDVTEVFGLEPHSRYYDPFLNYYCVRGRVDRFNEMFQNMLNKGVMPSNKIAEQALTCFIIAHHKGQVETSQISDKVQEMYNAYRVRPSSSGIIRLLDYLLYIGDEQEARRAVVLVEQLFTERERVTEINWPSRYSPSVFFRSRVHHDFEQFARCYPKKGIVYRNGPFRDEAGLLTADSLEQRFKMAGFELYPSPSPSDDSSE